MKRAKHHHEWLAQLIAIHAPQPMETLAEVLFDRDAAVGGSQHHSMAGFSAPEPHGLHGLLIAGVQLGDGKWDTDLCYRVAKMFSLQVGDMYASIQDVPNESVMHVVWVPPRQNYGLAWTPDPRPGPRNDLPPSCKLRINGWTIRELPPR